MYCCVKGECGKGMLLGKDKHMFFSETNNDVVVIKQDKHLVG